jgi:hypothetical protein
MNQNLLPLQQTLGIHMFILACSVYTRKAGGHLVADALSNMNDKVLVDADVGAHKIQKRDCEDSIKS